MDEDLFKTFLEVRKTRGRDEFHIYKNYNTDLPRQNMEMFFKSVFSNQNILNKNDSKASDFRQVGNVVYAVKDFEESYTLYSKSLRYAPYDSENYATALANRSAVLFSTYEYKDCIKDIDLCLNARCQNSLRLKVLLRKAKCLQNLGDAQEMKSILQNVFSMLNEMDLPKETLDTHRTVATEMLKNKCVVKKISEVYDVKIPPLEMNPVFLNASKAVALKYNKQTGRYVIAKQDIPQGEVLFVEKAYAFAPAFQKDAKISGKYNCKYCLAKTRSFVPCKLCVQFIFCTEKCRDLAWHEFHQWECFAIRAGLFSKLGNGCLAFRIVMKAALSDFQTTSTDCKQDVIKYGDKDNNYAYVHKLCTHFENMNNETAMKYAACASVMVTYLQQKTSFFKWLKGRPAFSDKLEKDLHNQIGSLLLRHLAQFACNSIQIKGFDEVKICRTEVGSACLPSISMMSHSCIPNISYYFIGNTAVVKAIRKINANEKICYAYMDLTHFSLPKIPRQMVLAEACCFKCRCQACTNPAFDTELVDSYLCVKCKGPTLTNVLDIIFTESMCICLNCKHKFTVPEEVLVNKKLVAKYLERFKEEHNIDDANRSLAIVKTIVNKNHSLFQSIHYALMEYYIHQRADLVNFMRYVKILVNHGHQKYGNIAFENGIFIYNMCYKLSRVLDGHALRYMGTVLEDAIKILEEAKLIFDLYHPAFNGDIKEMEERFKTKKTELEKLDSNGGDFLDFCCKYCGLEDDFDDDDDEEDYEDYDFDEEDISD